MRQERRLKTGPLRDAHPFSTDRPPVIPASLLQATLDLMSEVDSAPRPADAVTSAWFRAHRGFDDADRGALIEWLYTLLRHRARLGWWLARHNALDTARNRLLAWLALAEGQTADEIKRHFAGAGAAQSPLTPPEAALAKALQGQSMRHPDMPEDVALECPSWAVAPLRRRFGDGFSAELAATLLPPPLDLRVNPMKSTRAAMLQEIKALGLRAEPTPLAPHGIRLPERVDLSRLPGLKTGALEIQDEGSQLIAALVDARPGDRVVDFCAGAGGKTLALAAQMKNKGHVVACDVNDIRLKRCAERLRRAGLHNVEVRVLSSETDRWIKRHKGGFDRVLVDAPCSGTGTWRRNPDARARAPDLGLEALISLQARILASAARLVKPGGRLVYATCSLLCEENEDQVARFIAANPAFRIVPLAPALPDMAGLGRTDHRSLTPAQHGTDGFFAAVMQRESAPV